MFGANSAVFLVKAMPNASTQGKRYYPVCIKHKINCNENKHGWFVPTSMYFVRIIGCLWSSL